MNYKQKYESLMKNIEHLHASVNPEWKQIIECYIPEFKESDDEKISKELISYLSDIIDNICSEEDISHDAKILGGKIRHWIAWLEKQGEQKPTEDNCKISDCVETVDMTEYNNGYECGKQRVLKYPEEYGLCKKPAWSEEDEKILSTVIEKGDLKLSEIDWLKSLRQRMKEK